MMNVLDANGVSGILLASAMVCDRIVAISCLQAAIFCSLVHLPATRLAMDSNAAAVEKCIVNGLPAGNRVDHSQEIYQRCDNSSTISTPLADPLLLVKRVGLSGASRCLWRSTVDQSNMHVPNLHARCVNPGHILAGKINLRCVGQEIKPRRI